MTASRGATTCGQLHGCHRTDGSGYARFFPELRGNPVLLSWDPVSLIHIVLQGQTLPGFKAAPSSITMPPFGWRLDDQQLADVVTFIRGGWESILHWRWRGAQIREDKSLFPDPRVSRKQRRGQAAEYQP